MNEENNLENSTAPASLVERLVIRNESRYPYTYSADYLRMEIGDDYGKGPISRSAAAKAKSLIADITGMDEEELACKLANKYIEKYGV